MDITNGTPGSRPANEQSTADDARPDLPGGYPGHAVGARPPRRHRVVIMSAALAAAAVIATGSALAIAHGSGVSGTAVAAPQRSSTDGVSTAQPVQPAYGEWNRPSPWGGSSGQSSAGNGLTGPGGAGTAATLSSATASQEVGVVDIDTVLGYAGAEAAGTGMVLTSTGEILTNNHVVEGATSISVTVIATGASYPATVIGTDATDDVAVLQLSGVSGLSTADIADTPAVAVGDAVTGVGNAGGAGGTPSASPGTVTATDQRITTQAEGSAASETLKGLIETDADIQAGDSGGPLFSSSDQVVGIDTAAEDGGTRTAGYAIPISTALGIAGQIESGHATANIVLGYPAFLGVQVGGSQDSGYGYSQSTTTQGAPISGVISGAPAAVAGLTAGDTIVGIDATSITSGSALTSALAGDTPGQNVTITWVDASGSSYSASVTLASGPAA